MRVGFAPHFIRHTVAAFVALLPVPRVTGKLATGLLLVELQGKQSDRRNDEDGCENNKKKMYEHAALHSVCDS